MAAWRTVPERDYGVLAGASYTVRHLWWGELCLVISPASAWSPSHLSLLFFRVASSHFPLWHMQQLQTLDWLRPAWDSQSQSSPLPCSSRELPGLRSLFEDQPSAIIAHTGPMWSFPMSCHPGYLPGCLCDNRNKWIASWSMGWRCHKETLERLVNDISLIYIICI